MYIWYVYVCVYVIPLYVCIHVWFPLPPVTKGMYVCMYDACWYVRMCMCVCMYACMCV